MLDRTAEFLLFYDIQANICKSFTAENSWLVSFFPPNSAYLTYWLLCILPLLRQLKPQRYETTLLVPFGLFTDNIALIMRIKDPSHDFKVKSNIYYNVF